MTAAQPVGNSSAMGTKPRRLISPEQAAIGARVKALRVLLDLSHQEVATAGGLARQDVSRAESGERKMTTKKVRDGLAVGLGLTPEQFDALTAGDLAMEDAVLLAKPKREPSVQGISAGYAERVAATKIDVTSVEIPLVRLVAKLGYANDMYSTRVIRSAQETATEAQHEIRPNTDLEALARSYLDAARSIEKRGGRLDPRSIGIAASVLRTTTPARVVEEQSAQDNSEAAEEERLLREPPELSRKPR